MGLVSCYIWSLRVVLWTGLCCCALLAYSQPLLYCAFDITVAALCAWSLAATWYPFDLADDEHEQQATGDSP
jgi:hypothetical protein